MALVKLTWPRPITNANFEGTDLNRPGDSAETRERVSEAVVNEANSIGRGAASSRSRN